MMDKQKSEWKPVRITGLTDKALDFTDGAGRKHVSDAAWEIVSRREPGVPRDGVEKVYIECGLMLVTREEWREMQAALADKDEWIDELEARYRIAIDRLRSLVPNSGTNAPKSRTGALLLTRETDARLGFGDAGEER